MLTRSSLQRRQLNSSFLLGALAPASLRSFAQTSATASRRELIPALEKQAADLGLPDSPLAITGGPSRGAALVIATHPREVLRLAALIERAADLPKAASLSDQAAQALADLNTEDRSPPDGVKSPGQRAGVLRFEPLKSAYRTDFESMKVRTELKGDVRRFTDAMIHFKSRYQKVGDSTEIPWYFIAITHYLEASLNFRAHLHNGDYPLSQRTRNVPQNMPKLWLPPSDWEDSAVDALTLMGFRHQTDWSIERMLYRFEAYNGFGYRPRRINSPYLWSFSDKYKKGKYRSDGQFDPDLVSRQIGAAVLLRDLKDRGGL